MNNNIELKAIGEGVHLQLPTPASILSHFFTILLNGFIIFNEWRIKFLVFHDILHCCNSVAEVLIFFSLQLISDCPEEAVPVCFYFF